MVKWITLILSISAIILMISSFFLKKEASREMKSKFESGIDQDEHESPPFYMHFFYIALLFLIFDVEMVLSIPMIQSIMTHTQWSMYWIFFMLLILVGLVLETNLDSIEWKE